MANDSAVGSFGKLVLGGAAGFALYFFITGLGFGGAGRGKGRGDGRGSLPVPVPTRRPQDAKRLTFVMQEPTSSGQHMIFRLRDDDPSTKTYTLEETIARIKTGGRSDISLLIRGGVIQGSANKALELFKVAGIEVWKDDARGQAHVSGNARGYYG